MPAPNAAISQSGRRKYEGGAEYEKKILISEYWDGGHSETADTLKEAEETAQKLLDNIRWTEEELRRRKRRVENYIIIERIFDDGTEYYISDGIAKVITINEKTLHCIY